MKDGKQIVEGFIFVTNNLDKRFKMSLAYNKHKTWKPTIHDKERKKNMLLWQT
jgi:hypothetical protein